MSKFAGSNKFFGGGETSSEEESDSEQSQEEQKTTVVDTKNKTAAKLIKNALGDESEDEADRTVRTKKEKRFEVIDKIRLACENDAKNADFNKLETDFDALNKIIEKDSEVIYEGKEEKLPKSILKTLVCIQDAIDSVDAADKKKKNFPKAVY